MNMANLESALPSDDAKREENMLLFADKLIRHAFMRKVFSIVLSQIILTCIIVAPMILHQPTREMLIKDRGIYWASYILFIAVYMAIICCNGITRSWPQNYIILLVMTVALSVWVGCICARFDPKLVLIALGICFILCSGLYLFATQTAIDFTATMGILLIFALALLVLSILHIFFPTDGLTWILLIGGAVLLSVYFVIDIQLMMGGGHKYSLSPEDYILAATLLYVDIIFLFIYILMILDSTHSCLRLMEKLMIISNAHQ